ncbi:MAG: glycosyltransferase family 4 protein [Sphingomonas bacterium]|nr:glycosyltransferase family 4 protein [Sphingomonas bacterium]
MKIMVVNSMAPFVWGGAEELAHHLVLNLRRAGHEAEVCRMPFAWEPFDKLPLEIARFKALRLSDADRVISLKFPVYMLEADHHTTWLIHQYRQAYDLWDTPYCNIPHTAEGCAVRDFIVASDNWALRSRDRLFTISDDISARLRANNDIEAPLLRAPINNPELFYGGDYGNYILATGRINASKRQALLIHALRYLDSDARLIIAGPPDSNEDGATLRQLVEQYDLADRVLLDMRFLTRKELAAYVNNCRAVAYLPFQEDSYGYVTMEAFEAGKPVITTSDSGGLLDIVFDEETGSVVEPEPHQLAQAMANYLKSENRARDHGLAGQALWRSKGINWPENISRLLGT